MGAPQVLTDEQMSRLSGTPPPTLTDDEMSRMSGPGTTRRPRTQRPGGLTGHLKGGIGPSPGTAPLQPDIPAGTPTVEPLPGGATWWNSVVAKSRNQPNPQSTHQPTAKEKQDNYGESSQYSTHPQVPILKGTRRSDMAELDAQYGSRPNWRNERPKVEKALHKWATTPQKDTGLPLGYGPESLSRTFALQDAGIKPHPTPSYQGSPFAGLQAAEDAHTDRAAQTLQNIVHLPGVLTGKGAEMLGAPKPVADLIGGVGGFTINPLEKLDFMASLGSKPLENTEQFVDLVHSTWGATHTDGRPVKTGDRIAGIITLFGTAYGVDQELVKPVVEGARLNRWSKTLEPKVVQLLSEGVPPDALEAALGRNGPVIVKKALKAPGFKSNTNRTVNVIGGDTHVVKPPTEAPPALKEGPRVLTGNEPKPAVELPEDLAQKSVSPKPEVKAETPEKLTYWERKKAETKPVVDTTDTQKPETREPSSTQSSTQTSEPSTQSEGLETHRKALADIRETLGWDQYEKPDVHHMRDLAATADKEGWISGALALADQVLKKPKTLSDAQTAGLSIKLQEHLQQMEAYEQDGNGEQYDLHKDAAHKLADALDRTGTEAGRSLNAKKLVLKNDYSEFSMERKAKQAKPLATAQELANAKAKGLKVREKQVALATATQNATRTRTATTLADLPRTDGGKRVLVSQSTYEAARAKWNASGTRLPGGKRAGATTLIDPEKWAAGIQIVGYHIESGIRAIPQLLTKIKADMPGISEEDALRMVDEGVSSHSQKMNQGRGFGEDVLIQGKSGISSPDIAKLRGKLDSMRKELRNVKNTPNQGLLTELQGKIKNLDRLKGPNMDKAAYEKVRAEIGEISKKLNQGRGEGADLLRQGQAAFIDPDVIKAREALDQAKMEADKHIRDLSIHPAIKALKAVTDTPRFLAVGAGLHGPALMGTHALKNAFRPSTMASWYRNTFNAWKVALSPRHPELYNALVQGIKETPPGGLDYETRVRIGLKVDRAVPEDFTLWGKDMGKLGKLLGSGTKAADMLKVHRNEIFNQEWSKLTPEEQALPGRAGLLADWANQATGAGSTGSGWGASLVNELGFAAKLESSNWASVVTGPLKSAFQLASKDPTIKADAAFRLKQGGQLVGTYLGMLGVNYGINSALGDEDNVNFTDPIRGDFMLFKFKGRTIGLDRQTHIINFLARELQATYKEATKTPAEIAGQYVQGKLSPFYSLGSDAIRGKDFIGRPMPWVADDRKQEQKEKYPQYTLGELLTEHGPIPFADGARAMYDSMRHAGAGESQSKAIMEAVFDTLAGLGGVRVGKTPSLGFDAFGRPKTRNSGKDPVLNEMDAIGYQRNIHQQDGETKDEFEARKQEGYDDAKTVFATPEYKALKTKKERHDYVVDQLK